MLDQQDEGEAGARAPSGGVSACSGVIGVAGLRCDCGCQTEEKGRFASRFRSRSCEVLLRKWKAGGKSRVEEATAVDKSRC